MNRQPAAEPGRRCPTCGALVSADADWCGQCFSPLREPTPPPPPAPRSPSAPAVTLAAGVTGPAAAPSEEAPAKVPMWPCPTCGRDNPIDLDACAVCGTSFATMMRQEPERPRVDPKDALVRSLIFPGLGHRLAGYPLDGLARGVLFGMLAVLAILVAFSGVRTGTLKAMFLLFLLLALVVYVGSALEAFRLASGGDPLVDAKQILWATVAVVLLSVGMLALSVITSTKR